MYKYIKVVLCIVFVLYLVSLFSLIFLDCNKFFQIINFISFVVGLGLAGGIIKQREIRKEEENQRKIELEKKSHKEFLDFLAEITNKHDIINNINRVILLNNAQASCPKIGSYKLMLQQTGEISFQLQLYNEFLNIYGWRRTKNQSIKNILLKDINNNLFHELKFLEELEEELREKGYDRNIVLGTKIIKNSIDYHNSNLICLRPNCIYKNQKYCCQKKYKKNKKFPQNIIYEILKENW